MTTKSWFRPARPSVDSSVTAQARLTAAKARTKKAEDRCKEAEAKTRKLKAQIAEMEAQAAKVIQLLGEAGYSKASALPLGNRAANIRAQFEAIREPAERREFFRKHKKCLMAGPVTLA